MKDQKVHSVFLSSVHLQSVRWEMLNSVSQCMNVSAKSQHSVWFGNAENLESSPIEQASLVL